MLLSAKQAQRGRLLADGAMKSRLKEEVSILPEYAG